MQEEAGFTAVVCTAPGCGVGDPATVAGHLVDVVRDVVGSSRHGVMVATGCLLGALACRFRPAAPLLLVQPCDTARRPTAPVLRIGPLRTTVDVDAVGGWLCTDRLDPRLLPAHLLTLHRRAAAAPPH
jgi:hypothetical protein